MASGIRAIIPRRSIMTDKKLSELYYDPETGFQSAARLYKKAKELGADITLKEVQDFLKEQEVAQLTKPARKQKGFTTIKAAYPGDCMQMDIMVYDRFTFHNYKYILCLVDVYSRRAAARAMTNRRFPT